MVHVHTTTSLPYRDFWHCDPIASYAVRLIVLTFMCVRSADFYVYFMYICNTSMFVKNNLNAVTELNFSL